MKSLAMLNIAAPGKKVKVNGYCSDTLPNFAKAMPMKSEQKKNMPQPPPH